MTIKFDRKKINYIMLDRGIASQAELARKAGVAANSVSLWLAGDSFTSTTLTAFCSALECTPNDVLDLGDLAVYERRAVPASEFLY